MTHRGGYETPNRTYKFLLIHVGLCTIRVTAIYTVVSFDSLSTNQFLTYEIFIQNYFP